MLHLLSPDPNTFVGVQQTEFSHDMLGRWCCGTWDEVSNNGGDPFDVVVIGAGMFGGYIADKLYRRAENIGLRVLVVDAGSFLLPTHTQNLPRLVLNAPTEQVVAKSVAPLGSEDIEVVYGFGRALQQPNTGTAGEHLVVEARKPPTAFVPYVEMGKKGAQKSALQIVQA